MCYNLLKKKSQLVTQSSGKFHKFNQAMYK